MLYHGKVATRSSRRAPAAAPPPRRRRSGTPVPYLVSVADPYDTLSPYHDWGPILVGGTSRPGAEARRQVDACRRPTAPSGRVQTVIASAGDSRRPVGLAGRGSPSACRRRGSRRRCSRCCRRRTDCLRGAVTLTGFAHAGPAAVLTGGEGPSRLAPGRTGRPRSTGAFTVDGRPAARTQYRLAWGILAGLMNFPWSRCNGARPRGQSPAGDAGAGLATRRVAAAGGTAWARCRATENRCDRRWTVCAGSQPAPTGFDGLPVTALAARLVGSRSRFQ